jgi:hypothetical protein
MKRRVSRREAKAQIWAIAPKEGYDNLNISSEMYKIIILPGIVCGCCKRR